jgi:antitoxin component YwqK of YwqJK toxin-antitoxin module
VFQLRTILVLLMLLFAGDRLCAEVSVYRSNSLGIELERSPSDRLAGSGYELRVETAGGTESARLYLDGEEVERWERMLSPEGRLLEQEHYASTDDGDVMLYREQYAYSPAGRLRETTRIYPEGTVHITSYGFADSRLAEERILQGRELFVTRYNERGKLLEWAYYVSGELAQKKVWEYNGSGDVPRSLMLVDLSEDVTTYTRFDEEGRTAEEEKTGSITEKTIYQRNRDGQLTAKIKMGDRGREEWRYRYDENGEVEREDYYLKGALERSRVYAASDTWYEEIYRSGEVFLRISYQEGQKVKEEFISEGEVVRERRYP